MSQAYIETAADHAFTAFLASLTVDTVLRDWSTTFSEPEEKRDRFLRQKSKHERAQIRESEIYIALRMAREMQNTQQKAS